MENFIEYLRGYLQYVVGFMSSVANPAHRLFAVFLITSLLTAVFVFRHRRMEGTVLSFLFPKEVWSHPTAWLDVRYFFFHGLIGRFLIRGLGLIFFAGSVYLVTGLEGGAALEYVSPHSLRVSVAVSVAFFIIIALTSDFAAFLVHFLQHKTPILWQFHKVHHAGEVMHPLSNFREHPVDNLAYAVFVNLITGVSAGLVFKFLDYIPSTLQIFGLSITSVLFNLCAYHLRHSHIWLKWPGNWSKVFPSPAHHHVHHSRHPDHLDKNFAFVFPVWDVIFGTYVMPKDNRDVEFGIVADASELNSCINLYLIPFRDAYRVIMEPKDRKDVAKDHSSTRRTPS